MEDNFGYKWIEVQDYENKCSVFLNMSNGEMKSNEPTDGEILYLHTEHWLQIRHDESSHVYYYNIKTKETTWIKPEHGIIVPLSKLQEKNLKYNNVDSTTQGSFNRLLTQNQSRTLFKDKGTSSSSHSGDSGIRDEGSSNPNTSRNVRGGSNGTSCLPSTVFDLIPPLSSMTVTTVNPVIRGNTDVMFENRGFSPILSQPTTLNSTSACGGGGGGGDGSCSSSALPKNQRYSSSTVTSSTEGVGALATLDGRNSCERNGQVFILRKEIVADNDDDARKAVNNTSQSSIINPVSSRGTPLLNCKPPPITSNHHHQHQQRLLLNKSLINPNTSENSGILSTYNMNTVQVRLPTNQFTTTLDQHTFLDNQQHFLPLSPQMPPINVSPNIMQTQSFTPEFMNFQFLQQQQQQQNNASFNTMSTAMNQLIVQPGWNPNIFYSQKDLSKFLTWTKKSLKRPMLLATSIQLKKDVCHIFKCIQIYMGDRERKGKHFPPNLTEMDLLQHMLLLGRKFIPLRDEIYMQLCRQTCRNTNDTSMHRGWQLMGLCISFFPPSVAFRPYLIGYVNRFLTISDDNCSAIGRSYQRIVEVIIERLKSYAMGVQIELNKPNNNVVSQDEIFFAMGQIAKRNIFGLSLIELMEEQHAFFPSLTIPCLLANLVQEIIRLQGHLTAGIFRVSAPPEEVGSVMTYLQNQLLHQLPAAAATTAQNNATRGSLIQIPCNNPHTIANILKLWLAQMPDAFIGGCDENDLGILNACLIVAQKSYNSRADLRIRWQQKMSQTKHSNDSGNTNSFEQDINISLDEWEENEAVEEALQLVSLDQVNYNNSQMFQQQIPYIKRLSLAYIIWLLQYITDEHNTPHNLVDSYSLASILSPLIFKHPALNSTLQINLVSFYHVLMTEFVFLLIDNWDVSEIAITSHHNQ